MSERVGACSGRRVDWMELLWLGGGGNHSESERSCAFRAALWSLEKGYIDLSSSRPFHWCSSVTIKGVRHGGNVLLFPASPLRSVRGLAKILSKPQVLDLVDELLCDAKQLSSPDCLQSCSFCGVVSQAHSARLFLAFWAAEAELAANIHAPLSSLGAFLFSLFACSPVAAEKTVTKELTFDRKSKHWGFQVIQKSSGR